MVLSHIRVMESAPIIEEFFNRCFQERTQVLQRMLEVHQTYWQRFYAAECHWDSRRGVIERSKAEQIISSLPSDSGFNVITTGNTISRSRYRVLSSGDTLTIQEVDLECQHCQIFGLSATCADCGGSGWLSWKDRKESFDTVHSVCNQGATELALESDELEALGRDDATERFMSDLFHERTRVWQIKSDIYASYVRQFFSPDFDWQRWVTRSGEERLLRITRVADGVRVITSGIHKRRLRYHLRPTAKTWIIYRVDSECPTCYQKGREMNCFWCGGTIWNRRKSAGSE